MAPMTSLKSAILLVSFGTAVKETRKKTLDVIEQDLRLAFPSMSLIHAWTSRILREKVRETEGLLIPDISEALADLAKAGVRSVYVLPTFVTDGMEYRQMIRDVQAQSDLFETVQIAAPLLGEEQDTKPIISALMVDLPSPSKEELLVLMGHGASNDNDIHYEQLNHAFHTLGYENIFVKTMKSSDAPDEILEIAKLRRIRKITLAPFMIVAGGHALKDMSGDNEHSWKSRLEAEGFTVHCLLKGLGEYNGIRRIFISRASQIASF